MDEWLLVEAIRGNFLVNKIILIQPNLEEQARDMPGWVNITFAQSASFVHCPWDPVRTLPMSPLHAARCRQFPAGHTSLGMQSQSPAHLPNKSDDYFGRAVAGSSDGWVEGLAQRRGLHDNHHYYCCCVVHSDVCRTVQLAPGQTVSPCFFPSLFLHSQHLQHWGAQALSLLCQGSQKPRHGICGRQGQMAFTLHPEGFLFLRARDLGASLHMMVPCARSAVQSPGKASRNTAQALLCRKESLKSPISRGREQGRESKCELQCGPCPHEPGFVWFIS